MKMASIFLFIILNFKYLNSETIWSFSSGVNGTGGLMIIYKTLPPLVVDVDTPKLMRVKKGNDIFKYSEASGENKPLNVRVKVQFNTEVVEDNGINKEIIKNIYNNITLSFKNYGRFQLKPLDKNNDLNIEAQAYFTDFNGVKINDKAHPIINKNLGDTISNGLLSQNDIYIDAEFNKERKNLLAGEYKGTVILEVEFNGKNISGGSF